MLDRHAERGMALAMVLAVGLLLTITTMALLRTVGFQFHSVESQRRRDAAFYAAEAGIQAVWVKLQRNLPPFTNPDDPANPWVRSETMTVGGRAVTVLVNRIATNPNRFSIHVTTEAS